MKKRSIIIIIIIIALLIVINLNADQLEVPTKIKLIAQTCSEFWMFQTVIDLSNNEIVNLCYYCGRSDVVQLKNVIRTGMIVNPKDYNIISMSDAVKTEN